MEFKFEELLVGLAQFKVTAWFYWQESDFPGFDLKANYWWHAKILLDPDHTWGVDQQTGERARVAALVHEIGHAYGLHERYEPGLCNNLETTIMDTVFQVGGAWFPCDVYSPVPIDGSRVLTYWRLGEWSPHTLFPNVPSSGQGTWQWEDGFWAESYHYVEYWYHTWNSQTGTWNPWVRFDWEYINTNVGTHRTTEVNLGLTPRVFTRVKNRLAYNPPLPSGEYAACFYHLNWQWNPFPLGTQFCSNFAWLN